MRHGRSDQVVLAADDGAGIVRNTWRGAGQLERLARGVLIHMSTLVNFERSAKESQMLWTVFLILLLLWGLGMVSSYTVGGFIHILLVLALIAALVQVIQGRRVV